MNHQLKLPYNKVIVDDRLREQDVGIFENHTYLEYEAYFSSPEDRFILAAPQGESGSEVLARTQELLLKIAVDHPNETVLLVTHAYNCCHINLSLEFFGSFD